MELFYQPAGPEALQLDKVESRHCLRVLRKKEGDSIHLVDGKGNFIEATITGTENQICSYTVISTRLQSSLAYYIHLVVAPTKNRDRMEWLVEKAVEIGVDEISFVSCKHSERKKLNLERLGKKAIAAMKQSVKARLPQINPLLDFTDLIQQIPTEDEKFIAYVPADKQQLKNVVPPQKRYCLLIGPEGGFGKEEVKAAENSGFQVVSLGENRLRTETAALIGCHTFHLANV